jgi:ferric-dicitrate binding protein FerR (iron transport regulator)
MTARLAGRGSYITPTRVLALLAVLRVVLRVAYESGRARARWEMLWHQFERDSARMRAEVESWRRALDPAPQRRRDGVTARRVAVAVALFVLCAAAGWLLWEYAAAAADLPGGQASAPMSTTCRDRAPLLDWPRLTSPAPAVRR